MLIGAGNVVGIDPHKGRRRQRSSRRGGIVAGEHSSVSVCHAVITLEPEDTVAAADSAAGSVSVIGAADTERALGLELLAEARASATRAEDALAAARELRLRTRREDRSAAGRVRYTEGYALAAAGRFDTAGEEFEDAVAPLRRAKPSFEAGRARVQLARALRALERDERARGELERAGSFADLGASGEERHGARLPATRSIAYRA